VVREKAGEGALGRGHRQVCVDRVAQPDLADLGFGRGIEEVAALLAVRHDEAAVDVDLVDAAHEALLKPFDRPDVVQSH